MPYALLRAALAAIVACLLAPAIAAADAGDPDPSFGNGGVLRFTDPGGAPPPGQRIEALPDGGAYVLTEREAYGGGTPQVFRLTASGAVSSPVALVPPGEDGITYAADGVARHPGGAYTVVARRSGHAIPERVVLVRHTAAGAVDTTWGTNGVAFLPEGFFVSESEGDVPLIVLPSGAVAVGGAYPDPATGVKAAVIRVTAGGLLDPDFGAGGVASLGVSGALYALATDGLDVVAVGSAGGHLLVARLDETGDLDAAFGSDGLVTRNVGDFSTAYAVTVGEASTVSVAGITGVLANSRTQGVVARFLDDGTPDPGFGEGGVRTTALEADDASSAYLYGLAEDNGRLYAVGSTGSPHSGGGGDTFELVAARFDATGSLDTSFAGDGIAVLPDDQAGSGYESGTSAALDPDGRLLVTGNDQSKLIVTRLQTAPSPPTNEQPPAVEYAEGFPPRVGQTVTANRGTWRSASTVAYAYRWERCPAPKEQGADTTGCTAIAGATGQSYDLTPADGERNLRVVVTATNAAGDTASASSTVPVYDAEAENVSAPTLAPERPVRPGEQLVATDGEWTGSNLAFTRRWLRCPSAPAGDTGGCEEVARSLETYVATAQDVGRFIRVEVTAGNARGSRAAYSPLREVVGAPDGSATPPSVVAPPAIAPDGAVTEGATLSERSPAAFDGTQPISASREWQRCGGTLDAPTGCAAIAGATGEAYVTTAADAGRIVRLRVVGTNAAGSAVADSTGRRVDAKPVPPVAEPEQKPGGNSANPAKPANPYGLTGDVVYQDTTVTKVMPDVRGLQVDAAKQRIEQAGIHAAVNIKEAIRKKPLKLPGKSRLDIGDVSAQSVTAGAKVTSGIGTPKAIRLVTEAGPKATKANGGPFGSVCTGKAARNDLKGLGLGEVLDLLKAKRCTKVEIDYKVSPGAKEVEVRRAVKDGKELELQVVVPADPARFDLTAIFRQGAFNGRPSFGQEDWALTADAMNVMGIQVVNRAGKTVDGADVFVDASKVGADDLDGSARGGVYVTGFKPTKAGVAHVLVSQRDSAGNRIFGFGRFSVVSRRAPFTAIDGRRYSQSGALAAGARAAGIREIFAALGNLAQSLGAGVAQLFSGPVSEQTISTAAKQNVGLAQLSLGNLLSGNARVVAAGGANVVAAGGANVVAPGGANVVAPGGANVVAAGGANVVAAGGLNMISLASGNVVAAGGLNLLGKDMIANGTGTLTSLPAQVVAAGGANVVAAGGGNVIAPGGANVVAAGGLNLIGTASGNVLSTYGSG